MNSAIELSIELFMIGAFAAELYIGLLFIFGALVISLSVVLLFIGACFYDVTLPREVRARTEGAKAMGNSYKVKANAILLNGEHKEQYIVTGDPPVCKLLSSTGKGKTSERKVGGIVGLVWRMIKSFIKAIVWVAVAAIAGLVGSAVTRKMFK
jgi:hypothetical protein